jgi:hypothetical protein
MATTATITIPKKDYQELVSKALRYEYFKNVLQEDLLAPPPSRSAQAIVKDMQVAKHYSPAFVSSLEKGLRRSDYFTA